MADEIDRAAEEVEMFQQEAQRQRKKEAPGYTGECIWCGEKLEHPRRFCDVDCRDDYERYNK